MEDFLSKLDSTYPIFQHLAPGFLPKWLLLVGVIGIGNTIQNLFTDTYSKRLYAGKPEEMTPLAQRLFGTWTFSVSIIRFYGAFHINDPTMYQLVIWTYTIAAFHFGSELLYWKGAKLNGPVMAPVSIAVGTLFWLYSQYGYYIKA